MSEVICAAASGGNVGAVALIRLSGDKAFEIADKIFVAFNKIRVSQMQSHTCAYGKIVDADNNRIDDVLLTTFVCPHSYTGENVVEISCHGGLYVQKKIIRLCIENGAVMATAGEFTKRAFLNGKLSLTQAEAVMDIISADGERLLKSANNAREGRLYSFISRCTKSLISLSADLAAWVDYPEDDLPDIEPDAFAKSLSLVLSDLETVIRGYNTGKMLKNGIYTAIVGKPNVGKSTIMNILSGYQRSIVTDIAGTTRDVIEETVRISENIVLRLCDTAGIRETEDTVEKIGVTLAQKKADECDLIIAVFDNSTEMSEDDRRVLESLEKSKTVIIINKTDLEAKLDESEFSGFEDFQIIRCSAINDNSLLLLNNAIEKIIEQLDISASTSSEMFLNERQLVCCNRAFDAVKRAYDDLIMGISYDCITVTIDDAINALLELSGEKATEAVVSEVFSRFCVGK